MKYVYKVYVPLAARYKMTKKMNRFGSVTLPKLSFTKGKNTAR